MENDQDARSNIEHLHGLGPVLMVLPEPESHLVVSRDISWRVPTLSRCCFG